jgi:hypothetical protein
MRGSRMGTTVASFCHQPKVWSRQHRDFVDNNDQGTHSYYDEADMTS